MKKKQINIILSYDPYLYGIEKSVSEILKMMEFNVITLEEVDKVREDEYYFIIFNHLFEELLYSMKKKEVLFTGEGYIGWHLKGETFKKGHKEKNGKKFLEIPDDYIEKNIGVFTLYEKGFIGFDDYEPRIISFLHKLNVIRLYSNGIYFTSFDNILIDWEAEIEKGATIYPNTIIKGNTKIKRGAVIHPFTYIENSEIGENSVVYPFTHIVDSKLEKNCSAGPYSRLRQNTIIKEGAKTGDFVEMKSTVFGKGSKAMHLSYIGDATVGNRVNIGAGTITCNYDGEKKHPTIIKNNVFIGSGTELVAPVTIERNSYIGAGSTITKKVPPNSLAIARQRQENKKDWVLKRKKRK